MLGRSVGLSEAQIQHTGGDNPPEGVYSPAQAAIVRYGRESTKEIHVSDETYAELAAHYAQEQIMEIWALVGVANMINRFHATFHTDVDPETLEQVAYGNTESGACPLPMPNNPGKTL